MLKKQSIIERLISLLQGASWALATLGAFYAYTLFSPFGLFLGIVSAILGSLPGFIFVVIFEVANLQFDKLHELKKQTFLLERLSEQCDDKTLPHN